MLLKFIKKKEHGRFLTYQCGYHFFHILNDICRTFKTRLSTLTCFWVQKSIWKSRNTEICFNFSISMSNFMYILQNNHFHSLRCNKKYTTEKLLCPFDYFVFQKLLFQRNIFLIRMFFWHKPLLERIFCSMHFVHIISALNV